MLAYLPFEIQTQIMKKLRVKPLLRFRSVSKAWKSMIDSSHFIKTYEGAQVQHLLVITDHEDSYYNGSDEDYIDDLYEYVSIVDDDTFPHQRVSPFVPNLFNKLQSLSIIGSSHGLLCLCGLSYCTKPPKRMAFIWNISIQKAVAVVVPDPSGHSITLVFGVCRETNDPKIVKINTEVNSELETFLPWQVEVFSLSTGAWRSVVSNNLPRKSIRLTGSQVVTDGVMYLLAYDRDSENKIISFDITTEEFTQVNLPDSLARCHGSLHIYKIRNSLVVFQPERVADRFFFIFWMMEDGISVSFTKLYTIYHLYGRLVEFRKNGEHILECFEGYNHYNSSLAVYEPYTKCVESIGFDGTRQRLHVSSYMETLHLHDHLDSIVYYQGKPFVIDPYRRTMKQTHMKVNLGNTR